MTFFKKTEAKKIEANKVRELSAAEMLAISGGGAPNCGGSGLHHPTIKPTK